MFLVTRIGLSFPNMWSQLSINLLTQQFNTKIVFNFFQVENSVKLFYEN